MDADASTSRGRLGRTIVIVALGVVAVVGVVGAMVGSWAVGTATDSERFEERVVDLVQREEVSDALAGRVVAETLAVVDLERAAAELVPPFLGPLLQMTLAGVRTRVEDRLGEIIRTPEVAATVGAAAGRAHAATVDVIEGEPVIGGVEAADGEVRVNLLPLTARAIEAVQEIGLFPDVEVPDLVAGDPDAQRRQLAAALGRELPADFGQPVVYRSERIDRLGTTVDLVRDVALLAKRTIWLLAVGGVVAATAAIGLSRSRLRTAAFLLAGVFAAMLVVRILVGRSVERLPDAVDQPGAKLTVREIATDLQHSLEQTMLWYSGAALVVFVTVAAWAWSASRPHPGTER